MLQGPAGDGLDEIYDPEQSANGSLNITDAQYDMLHVRTLTQTLKSHCGMHGSDLGPKWFAPATCFILPPR